MHYENSCQSSAASAVASKRDSAVNHMVLAEETTEFGASQDHVEPADKDGIEGSQVFPTWSDSLFKINCHKRHSILLSLAASFLPPKCINVFGRALPRPSRRFPNI